MADVEEFEADDLDRLDGFDINRSPRDIVRYLMRRAGGDPMVALRQLVERNIELDDEYDAFRLMHDEERKKQGLAPLLEDAERRATHLQKRLALDSEQVTEDAEDDGYTAADLDYLHDVGWAETAGQRRSKLRIVRDGHAGPEAAANVNE